MCQESLQQKLKMKTNNKKKKNTQFVWHYFLEVRSKNQEGCTKRI